MIEPGAKFAGHRVESEIGHGGMGVVYRAFHLALDREVALKVIAPALSADEHFRDRFRRESRLAASIEHPNVIAVHHAGEEEGLLYLSMRLVRGDDLRKVVAASGPIEPRRAVWLVQGIAGGLDAAHAHGLIHRDVKPGNVLVEAAGDDERVFLTDFGISRTSSGGSTVTSAGQVLGSADYVAPEQIEGDPTDLRADVYALGCLLHYLLTGKPPFARDTELATLFAHANAPPPRPSEEVAGLPKAIDEVVGAAMAKDPDERYPSAGAVAADVRAALGGDALAGVAEPTRVAPPPPDRGSEPVTRALPRPSRRRAAILGVVGAVAAIAAAAFLVLSSDEGEGEGSISGAPPARVVATIPVGRTPSAIAVGNIKVWVASPGEGRVYGVDLERDRLVPPPITLGGRPTSVAVGFGSIWVVDGAGGALVRLNPGEGGRPVRIPVGAGPSDVAIGAGSLWVTNADDDSVSRVNPATNDVTARTPVGDSPRSVTFGEDAVWVANIEGGSISKIDPAAGKVVGRPVELGQRPNDLAAAEGTVWVTDVFEGTVTRIHPESLEVVGEPIEVGVNPRGIKVGLGYVWVVNAEDGTVTVIDPDTAEPVGAPIEVGAEPADVAIGKGAVWTANLGDGTVTRIEPTRGG